jgi:aquaporin Z
MRNYVTEFIGTFFLVFTISLTVTADVPLAPVAIGAALMVMVFMGGHVSGAHYNPAVTVAVFLRGKLPAKDVLPYWIAQIAGATAAAAASFGILNKSFPVAPGAGVAPLAALAVEFLFTFALALVVLNVATSPKTDGNSFYGVAIGFTVMAGAFAGGNISGGAFNPAVGIGPTIIHAIVGGGSWSHLWLYLVGPVAGAAAAVGVYKLQNPAHAVTPPAHAETAKASLAPNLESIVQNLGDRLNAIESNTVRSRPASQAEAAPQEQGR